VLHHRSNCLGDVGLGLNHHWGHQRVARSRSLPLVPRRRPVRNRPRSVMVLIVVFPSASTKEPTSRFRVRAATSARHSSGKTSAPEAASACWLACSRHHDHASEARPRPEGAFPAGHPCQRRGGGARLGGPLDGAVLPTAAGRALLPRRGAALGPPLGPGRPRVASPRFSWSGTVAARRGGFTPARRHLRHKGTRAPSGSGAGSATVGIALPDLNPCPLRWAVASSAPASAPGPGGRGAGAPGGL